MVEVMLPYGLRNADYRMVWIDEVANGLACECSCPSCGGALQAVQGEVNQHHFRHDIENLFCIASWETALHRLAKQIVYENPDLTVPGELGVRRSATLEALISGVRPDVLIQYSSEPVAIEIYVSNRVSPKKSDALRAAGLTTLEIDLSHLIDVDLTEAELRHAVLHVAPRQWLYSPLLVRELNRRMLRVLQIRLYGGSKTPAKYGRMLQQHVDGVLMGQYVFNGAAQTGRYSSKSVQIHNLARDALMHEPDLIDALLHECDYETLAKLGTDDPVARKLALLIRPALVPQDGKVFVWSDWSQIEARIVPWLAGDDPRAEARLQIFRDVDADPLLPDLYTRTASDVSHVPVEQITKTIRQRGKVAELALGYLGGTNALLNMAAGYGLHLEYDEAKKIVARWREANPWATEFGANLWEAMRKAQDFPGAYVEAGRIGFTFLVNYLGGSMLMRLPSGRCLTYRALKLEYEDVLDDDDQPTGERTRELKCGRGYGRVKLWPGILVENATQACAADFLRGTLVRLEDQGFCTRAHTHDECLVECAENESVETALALRQIMRQGFDWSEGLPLMSEETIAYAYSKHQDSYIQWE